MNTRHSLVKNTFIYSIFTLLTKSMAFLLIPIYTNYLSPKEYGTLALLYLILEITSFVFLAGIASASMRFYFDKNHGPDYGKQVYANATLLIAILLPFLFVLLTLASNFIISHWSPNIKFFPYVFLILSISCLTTHIKLVLGLLRAQNKALVYSIYHLLFFLSQMFSIIFAVVYLKQGLLGLLYAQFLTHGVFWLIAIVILIKNGQYKFSMKICKKLLVFGIPLIPFAIFSWISTSSGRFFLEKYGGLKEVALLALAMQFGGLLQIAKNVFNQAFVPHFYENAEKYQGKFLGDFLIKYISVFALLSLCILIAAPILILILTTPFFYPSIQYIPFLLLINWLNIGYNFFHIGIMHFKKTVAISTISVITAIANITLLYLFLRIQKRGIWGVIYCAIIVETLRISIAYTVIRKSLLLKLNFIKIFFVFVIFAIHSYILYFLPLIWHQLLILIIAVVAIDKLAGLRLLYHSSRLFKQKM